MYFVSLGSTPPAFASSPSRIWSVPPADPPANATARVRLHPLDEVLRSRMSDSALTTIASGSDVSARDRRRVVMSSGAWLVSIAPSITRPMTIIWLGLALALRGELREPDDPAGAGDVVDLDVLADQVAVLDDLRHLARGRVPAAAGVGRRHDLQVAARPLGAGVVDVVAARRPRYGDRTRDDQPGQDPRSRHDATVPPRGAALNGQSTGDGARRLLLGAPPAPGRARTPRAAPRAPPRRGSRASPR